MRSVTFHAILGPSKKWYRAPQLKRVSMRAPNLNAGEISIQIKLELPDDWDKQQTIPLVITDNQIQRPTARAIPNS